MNAVIFDMDGLMFDTESVFIRAWDYAGEKIGIGPAGYMNLKTLGMSIAASRDIWVAEFGDAYDEQALRRHTKEFLTSYYAAHRVPVKKGLYRLLDYLRGRSCKLAVASSSPGWEVEKHLRDAGIGDAFSAVVSGDMVERGKPDPAIYRRVCAMLEEPPEACYALEDSKNGLMAAHRAGCRPIMVPDLWQPDTETLSILAGRFDDLDGVRDYFAGGGLDAAESSNREDFNEQ